MVKAPDRIVTGAHYGLRDWLIQRISAVFMIFYVVLLTTVVFTSSPQDYDAWKEIFSHQWMRITTFLFFVCLFWHAWVGIRNILMDYVHATSIRLTLHILVIFSLLFYLVWSVDILWS